MLTFSAVVSSVTSTSPISHAELPRSGSVRILASPSWAAALQIAFWSLPSEPAALPPFSPGRLQRSAGAILILRAAAPSYRDDHDSRRLTCQSPWSAFLLLPACGHGRLVAVSQCEQFVTQVFPSTKYLTNCDAILSDTQIDSKLPLSTRGRLCRML